jgi:NADH dehydrogenase FAD-containing subunit
MGDSFPHVVIVGGGFGGLATAKALRIGDTALLDQDGHALPGVARVAIQQGRYTGKLIHRRIAGRSAPPPFRYFDKGNMAVVGKGFAVLAEWKVPIVAVGGVARMGGDSSSFPRPIEPARERVCLMGLDLYHRTARLAALRQPSQ